MSQLNRNNGSLLLAAAVALVSAKAVAVEPAAVSAGPVDIFPYLSIGTGYDSNFLQADTNELDTWVTTISPSLQAVAQQGANSYSANLTHYKGLVSSSSDDNFSNTDFDLQTLQVLNGRNQFNLGLGYASLHEPRGTGLSRGNPNLVPAPIEYHVTSYYGGYTYGAQGAKGQLDLSFGYDRTIYDNVRTLTAGRDNKALALGAILRIEVSPRTNMLFEVRNRETDYLLPATPQDNTDTRFLFGAEWEATGKTSGYAKFGQANKDFENPALVDAERFTWEVGVNYAWKTYSTFDFSTISQPNETGGVGNYIDSKTYAASWNHQWNDRLSTVAGLTYSDDEYNGVGIADEATRVNLSATYNFRRWLDFRLDLNNTDMSSTAPTNEFDQQVVTLTAQMSL